MAEANAPILALNRGLVSPLALARTDLKRYALSAEICTNFMARVLGSVMLRPGTAYLGSTLSNNQAKHLPFIFSATDTALVELTANTMRVRVADAIVQRVAVSTAISNPTFTGSLTFWTTADETGATSQWETGDVLALTGNGIAAAITRQQVSVAGGDIGKEHGLRITVTRGPVTLRVGSSSGADDYIAETSLFAGTHSLAFTPTGSSFWVQFQNTNARTALVDTCTIDSAGDMTLPTPWGSSDLANIRFDQSADVLFVACAGQQQQRIERRGTHSWSVAVYEADDGPFRLENTGPITIAPSNLQGEITLTASRALFYSGHVGSIFRIASQGQAVHVAVTGGNIWSNPVKVTGVGQTRAITIELTGTWVGTVTLQQSVGEPGAWQDVSGETWTANTTAGFTDGSDNQIIYYRLGAKTGQWTSGEMDGALVVSTGSISGIARIRGVTNSTSASASVLTPFGGTDPSPDWSEGAWSSFRGWPSAVALHEGRLWWAGSDNVWGSVSDAFASYDDTVEGDSGPISRSIGSGPVDTINWLLPLQRLILGGAAAEKSARSSSFDSPLTPTDFALKDASTQGSASIPAVKIDTDGIFVQRAARRIYRMTFSPNYLSMIDYATSDLTNMVPDIAIAAGGIVGVAVQRQPDTRIHAWLADGTVAVLVFDAAEEVQCWVKVASAASGIVEDVVVLPGTIEDQVYYCVRRVVNGATVRYLEKWAREDEAQGGTLTKCLDAHVVYQGSATTTISGLSHLNGQTVAVWADGKDAGTYTVANGAITLATAAANVVAGLPYTAQFQSTKLAYAAQLGTALTQRKRVTRLGMILANCHAQGITFGPDFATLDSLPQIEDGAQVDQNSIWQEYDKDSVAFPGTWGADSRVCLQAASPRPVTVLGIVVGLETREAV
jgi:hypothetical protein